MNQTASPNVEITIGDTRVPDADFLSYTVDRDMFQPDMAQVVLSNQGDIYSGAAIGTPVRIQVGDLATPIYRGEVMGVEPSYTGGEKTRIVIRAMNKFHRLLRMIKSVTYQDKTDEEILQQVASAAGLKLEWQHEVEIRYKHVYQHNQTDMEFLRTRAARAGCHVWCVDSTIYCKQPDLRASAITTLDVDESRADGALRSFRPRLNSTPAVKKVTVRSWDAQAKALIIGEAAVHGSAMGERTALSGSGSLGENEMVIADQPVSSKEEANMLAKAKLQDLSLGYITGEADCTGDPSHELGRVVEIRANGAKGSDTFNGKYYTMGLTHRQTAAARARDGGYTTTLRLARDAQGLG
ncbi:MAG TPA: contractile injection system protein, VgrG/Pvc8 family [Kofleriaceae bacterium]